MRDANYGVNVIGGVIICSAKCKGNLTRELISSYVYLWQICPRIEPVPFDVLIFEMNVI